MLYKYNKISKELVPLDETDFSYHNIMERQDIEKWVEQFPEILGEELLIITTEYDQFDKTKERLDLLALDKAGKLAVVELKRDDSGRRVELQAIKYAAYCSTMTLEDVVVSREKYLAGNKPRKTADQVKSEILNFINSDEFEEIDDMPRIILLSKEFRPEVTATVLWLRKFGVDITCTKLTPYVIDKDNMGLVSTTIIPLPEAEDYQIKAERKESRKRTLTRTQQEYISFFSEMKEEFDNAVGISLPKPRPQSYYQIQTGIRGVHFEWTFHGRPRSSLGVELHFEKRAKAENQKWLDFVRKFEGDLKKELQVEEVLFEVWNKRWTRIRVQKNEGTITEELKDWAVEKMIKMYNFLQPKLEEMQE